MSEACSFIPLLPEVQETLSPHFSLVECSLGLGPDLSRPPFNRPFRNLGQQITYVPDCTVVEDLDKSSQHEIALGEKAFVLTDSSEGTVMEIALEGGRDWLTPLSALFNNIFQSKWTFLVAEVKNGISSFHVISSKAAVSDNKMEGTDDKDANFSLWIVPVSKIYAIPPVKKVKIVKKVVKKRTPDGGVAETVDGVTKKILRKKKIEEPSVDDTSATGSNGNTGVEKKEDEDIVNGTKLNGRDDVNGMKGEEKSSSSSYSPHIIPSLDSNNSTDKTLSSETSKVYLSNGINENGSNGVSPLGHSHINGSSSSANTYIPSTKFEEITKGRNEEKCEESTDDEDIAISLRRKIMEREKMKRQTEEMKRDSLVKRPSSRSPTRILPSISEKENRNGLSRRKSDDFSLVPDIPMGRSGTFMKPRSFDLSPPRSPSLSLPTSPHIPVVALQIVLRTKFSFEELGELRRVHPHWDEICGQLLNGGYYSLLERTDRMLMKYQRRVHSDSGLHYPIAILTNIQVHVLNPVDLMRAALDEGICCFPYGIIIDKTILLLDEIERMVDAEEKRDIAWEGVAILSKRASLHYRTHLEETMEMRMGTCARLKAAQKIIRMDSELFLNDVSKMEKESARARDNLKWEMEQIQQSNALLKRENRQLKAQQMKLESRIESLENKLRSICRLLS